MKCSGGMYENCDKEADYIRHTQFAGSHPLCTKHAQEDKEFLVNDSYTFWESIPSIERKDD